MVSNTAAEASYCPKIVLNSSQEFILRNNQMQPIQNIISSNNSCLLPGHMIQANGPNSMQASSKPMANSGQGFLPNSNQNIMLSASFEKINLQQAQGNQLHNTTAKSGGMTFKQN